MEKEKTHDEAVKKLGELIKDINIAMLTTADEDTGVLRSRPMGTQKVEFNGDLWFFTRDDSPKVDEIKQEKNVNVSYASISDQRYVSVSGKATIIKDKAKAKELWEPTLKAFFPDGLDDPKLALLKVSVEQAEYWDSPSSAVVRVVGFVKALATGKPYEGGENEKLDLTSK